MQRLRARDRAFRNVPQLQEAVGAGMTHEHEIPLAVLAARNKCEGRRRVYHAHVVEVDVFVRQRTYEILSERITTDGAGKMRCATEPRDADCHVRNRSTGRARKEFARAQICYACL